MGTKYRNKPIKQGGIRFASLKEAKRDAALCFLQKGGAIRNLERQPRFPLIVNGIKVCTYIADFAYFENDKRVVEDVKSNPTKTPVYRLKVKLLHALNPGIDHREIM